MSWWRSCPWAVRARRVFAGEKQRQNNLQINFLRIRSSFLGFTICVGNIFFLPKVIKIASLTHEKGKRGNFSKEPLFLNPPPMAQDIYPQRNGWTEIESLGQTGSNKSKVKPLQTKAAAEQGCGGGNNAWLSRKL